MTEMTYSGDMARIQQALAQSHDLVVRRSAVLEALNLRVGEHVLELGCGGGFYAVEAARFVGPKRHVTAIDLSEDQIAAARQRCAAYPWVACQVGNATRLPLEDASLDAVYGVQVIEYIPDVKAVLKEIQRVLRPGGRLIVLATNWSSLIWHSEDPERMKRVLAAWDAHAPYPNLPSILAQRLRQAGLKPLRQTAIPIVNMSYHENSFSYWIARLIRAFLAPRATISTHEADAWLSEFDELEQAGAYFFASTPILTEAIKVDSVAQRGG